MRLKDFFAGTPDRYSPACETGNVALIPHGRVTGIMREGLNYYLDAPYNLAVSAAGPRRS